MLVDERVEAALLYCNTLLHVLGAIVYGFTLRINKLLKMHLVCVTWEFRELDSQNSIPNNVLHRLSDPFQERVSPDLRCKLNLFKNQLQKNITQPGRNATILAQRPSFAISVHTSRHFSIHAITSPQMRDTTVRIVHHIYTTT